MKKAFPLILAVLILAGCIKEIDVWVYGDNAVRFRVSVADNLPRRALGLMFRKELSQDEGMLFIYGDSSRRSFWMKNTRIPLDIIFIDEEKHIVNIEEAAPCVEHPCPRYHSRGEVKYVLEINRGLSRIYGFREATRVEFHVRNE